MDQYGELYKARARYPGRFDALTQASNQIPPRWRRARRSHFEHAACRQDIYRVSTALGEQFIAGFASPPKSLIPDLEHFEDACYGHQSLAFHNPHYGSTCYLPLMIFDGQSGALVSAVPRPGKRPLGEENATIMRRVLTLIRKHFPYTHILVRGDGHFSGPELMGLIDSMPDTDFIFGFSCTVKLLEIAEPTRRHSCDMWVTAQAQDVVPNAVRLFDAAIFQHIEVEASQPEELPLRPLTDRLCQQAVRHQ